MPLNPDKVLSDLKKGQYAPVYFLDGEEPFYIDRITEFIERNALEEAEKSFNETIVYGKECDMKTVLANAKRFPMMAKRQTVIVKEAQELQDLNKSDGRDMLLAYLKNPVPSTILVFAHKHKKIAGNTSLGKQLDKLVVRVQTKKIYDNQLPKWVADYFVSKGKQAEAKACQVLADLVGNDLSRIANEIDKLLLNVGNDEIVTIKDVLAQVGMSKEYNVFELQNALGKKEVFKANKILHYFAANPKANPAIPIIGALYAYFCKIIKTHQASDKSKDALARTLKTHPFFVSEYLQAGRLYPLGKCLQIISYLHQADLESKGVGVSKGDEALLKELVFKILH